MIGPSWGLRCITSSSRCDGVPMIPWKKSAAILWSVSISRAYCMWNFGVGGIGCGCGAWSCLWIVGFELAACWSRVCLILSLRLVGGCGCRLLSVDAIPGLGLVCGPQVHVAFVAADTLWFVRQGRNGICIYELGSCSRCTCLPRR